MAGGGPPGLTVIAVVATANHWWLDGVVASMVLGAAYLVVRLIEAAWSHICRSAWLGAATPAPTPADEPAHPLPVPSSNPADARRLPHPRSVRSCRGATAENVVSGATRMHSSGATQRTANPVRVAALPLENVVSGATRTGLCSVARLMHSCRAADDVLRR